MLTQPPPLAPSLTTSPRSDRFASLRITALRKRSWRWELTYFLIAYLMYTAARWIFVGDLKTAQTHAGWIVDLEKRAGVAVEGTVQEAFNTGFLATVMSNVYLAAQLLVLPASLIWLYHRSKPLYRRLRTTIVATWLIAVPIMALFPVAPPRLMGLGMTDTVSQQAAVALTGHSTVFYNPYAAVPSLHVGFAFAIGIALAAALRAPWAKLLAGLWGPIVTLTVVATANHYVFDIAAGLIVTAAGYYAGRALTRRSAVAAAKPKANVAARPLDRRVSLTNALP